MFGDLSDEGDGIVTGRDNNNCPFQMPRYGSWYQKYDPTEQLNR